VHRARGVNVSDREGFFAGDDPFAIARAWLDTARASEPRDPDAAALATVDAEGLPNVRVVLMRGFEANGFVFYTNYQSAKGQEIDATGRAAFVIHWKSLGRQIRARGPVARVTDAESDAYFAARPGPSRVGAWASRQSQPLAARSHLEAEIARFGELYSDDAPRPSYWGGYRLTPVEMEFWDDGAYRLHDRFRWRRSSPEQPWEVVRLNP